MANIELVEYIKQQLKLGEKEESVKQVLKDAGWTDMDINDAMAEAKKNAPTVPPPVTSPAPASASPMASSPDSAVKRTEPASPMGSPMAGPASHSVDVLKAMGGVRPTDLSGATKESFKVKSGMGPVFAGSAAVAVSQQGKIKKRSPFWMILSLILILGAAAAAVYFYLQYSGSDSELSNLKTGNAALGSQVLDLSKKLTAASSSLDAMKAQNEDLQMEVSFFVTPAGAATGSQIDFTLRGLLSVNDKKQFSLKTQGGIAILIKNSVDAKVQEALAPQVANTITISGTHAPGSTTVTVTGVNGVQVK